MAWTYEETFNSLTTGDLNGQDSWSGAANYDVSTTNPYEGAKCAVATGDGTERLIVRDASYGNGELLFYVSLRSADTSSGLEKRWIFKISASSGQILQVQFNADAGNIKYLYQGGTSATIVTGFTANQWYRFGFSINTALATFKINVDGGSWSTDRNYNSGTGTPSSLHLEMGLNLSGQVGCDFISPNYNPPISFPFSPLPSHYNT